MYNRRMSKRIVFTFDDRSFETLNAVGDAGGFESLASTVRESLRMMAALQKQAKQGFTEIHVFNPSKGTSRVMAESPVLKARGRV